MPYDLIFHTHVEADISEAYNWYEDKESGLGSVFYRSCLFVIKNWSSIPNSSAKQIHITESL